jgi:hypothetical protein
VRGLKPGVHYAYRIDGPTDPAAGHRFNRNKVVIDPYAKGTTNTLWDRGKACGPEDNQHASMRSVVIDLKDYDWEGDAPLRRPMAETVIYENARGRIHAVCLIGKQTGRHLFSDHRENSLSQISRRNGGRTAARVRF